MSLFSPWSVDPCTFDSPRMALTPPPATPMLPSSSCKIAYERMFWVPWLCWAVPMA